MARITIIATGGTRAPTQLDLAERFLADGHQVRCISSHNALRFLFSHMIRRPWKFPRFLRLFRPYLLEFFAYFREKPKDVPHVSEGKWADAFVMAPATCNSVGKLVAGITDNYPLLVLRAVPRTKKVIVVPSMNPEMWYDPYLQRNVDLLNTTEKYRVLCPSRGQMLSGDYGFGAQVPFEDIITETYRALGIVDSSVEQFLAGKHHAPVPWSDGEGEAAEEAAASFDVVLVDEDRKLMTELSSAIRREHPSFRLHLFATASEALDWLRDHDAALVVTELHFSHGASGFDLIDHCRRPGRDQIQLIATSDRDRREVGAESLARNDVLYMPKPINVSFAVGMIAGCLQGVTRQRTAMVTRRLDRGEVLFREGEAGSQVYVVQSGSLRVIKERDGGVTELGTVGERGMVGEMAFFGKASRAATVEATEPTELIELDLDHLRDFMERQPVWLRTMIDSLVQHLRETGKRVADAESSGTLRAFRTDSTRREAPDDRERRDSSA